MLILPRVFSALAILPCVFALGCSADAAPEEEPANEGALHSGESNAPLSAKDFTLVEGTLGGSASKMYEAFAAVANMANGEWMYAGLFGRDLGYGPDGPLGGQYDDQLTVWGVKCLPSRCVTKVIVKTKDLDTKTGLFSVGAKVVLRGRLATSILKTLKETGHTEVGAISCSEEGGSASCKVDIKSDLATLVLDKYGEEQGMKVAKAFFPDL